MRICILTHTFPRNDKDTAAAFMKEFSDGLAKIGNKVVVVTPFDKEFKRHGDPFRIYTYKYIYPDSLHSIGYSKTMDSDVSLKKRSYFLLPFMLFFGILKLLYVVRKEKTQVINVHWILPNGAIALIVSKLTNIPYVITLPGTDAYLAHKYPLFGSVAKFIAQNSSGIVSNSSWHLKRILNLGVNSKKTDVISYPVDVKSFKPIKDGVGKYRSQYGFGRNDLIILAVGRLVYKKGFEYLIKAMPGVIKMFPSSRLVIGGDGDLKIELMNLIKKLKLQNNVYLVGNIARDEIIYYYNLSDVMVAPSIVDKTGNVDGGPVVTAESMACGKPQILTNVLGMADVLLDSVNGFIVNQKDSKALANALLKLLGSPKLREQMGKKNIELVKEKLSTENVGKKYLKFFDEILSN